MFRIASGAILVLDGRMIPGADAQSALDVLRQGIDSHSEVASLRATWQDAT